MNNQPPKLYLPTHLGHSETDWDFSEPEHNISNDQYVSPPSSLRCYQPPSLKRLVAICKAAGTTNLPSGRIVTYIRCTVNSNYGLIFRQPTAPGGGDWSNCYCLDRIPGSTFTELYKRVASAQTAIGNFTPCTTWGINTWKQIRLTWWMDWGVLSLKYEQWEADEWVQQGDILSDASPSFVGASYLRPGLYAPGYPGSGYKYFDDTVIWAPA